MHTNLKLAVLLLALGACKGKSTEDKGRTSSGEPALIGAKSSNNLAGHLTAASTILEELTLLETEKDVTCWTSFRQLDWFIAEKAYGEFATLAKVRATKGLVRALWAKASETSSSGTISSAEIENSVELPAILALGKSSEELESFANDIGIKNFRDYQKTAEHWRLVLSVVQDELAEYGPASTLRPLGREALVALADAGTVLSLTLLKEAGAIAEADKSTTIETEHLSRAYLEVASRFKLEAEPRGRNLLSDSFAKKHLQPLTKELINGKFKALKAFNQGAGETLEDINKIARTPLDAQALEGLTLQLQSFVHFVAAGHEPMRSDNYLSDGSFANTQFLRSPYLSAAAVQNTVTQLFPHKILPNGDMVVRFEPNPGPASGKALAPFELRILDHEMNGVRDSAIHWQVMQRVWGEKAYAMDPFAAEYLSEVVSMMMATWIHQADLLAKQAAKSVVDESVARRIRNPLYVQVPIADERETLWADDRKALKEKLLSKVKAPLFKEVGKKSGLPTQLVEFDEKGERIAKTAVSRFDLQTIMGGGIAVGDVDSNGYDDLYITGEGLGRLYLGQGPTAKSHFVDATAEWGLPETLEDGHGTLFFDWEGDGDLDLLVLRSKHPSALYVQDKGRFEDKAKSLGLMTHYGAQVAHVFDFDKDGDLDIYVGYYGSQEAHKSEGKKRSLPSMDGRNGSPNQLWKNEGNRFVEVGHNAGLADFGWALAVGSFDYNQDGLLDLYVANDFGANVFFENAGNGRFVEKSKELGIADRGSGMNVDVAEISGDGAWDLFVTNIDMFSKNIKVVFPTDESVIDVSESLTRAFQYLSGSKLYVSGKDNAFRAEEGLRLEPMDRGWGWDAGFFDVENDGDEDLYLSNGWIAGSYAGNQANQLYLNDQGTFYHLGGKAGSAAFRGNTRSVAYFDFDRDGDIDILTNNFRQPPRLLENTQKSSNKWIRVVLKGKGKNPYAIGAELNLQGKNLKFKRQVSGGRGYQSQAPSRLLVGVGDEKFLDLEVRWPDGTKSSFKGLASMQEHQLAQP